MKCIRCGHDSKLKERTDRTCPACKNKFAFEPQSGDRFTDPAFQAAIQRVDSNGTVKFTADHLYNELARGIRPGCLSSVFDPFGLGWFGSAGLQLARADFDRYLQRWTQVHGAPAAMITPRRLTARSAALDTELEAYSFDRAVITDSAANAEVLLANGFHFENSCAILSFDGHPQDAFATVRRMLRQNPRIEVFALHDCTPFGCTLAWRLKHDPEWFQDLGVVYDVALRPAQAKPASKLWHPRAATAPDPAHPAITPEEAAWLADWELPLASIRPEQLIKRLFGAMTRMPAQTPEQGGTVDSGGVILWSTDATTADGGGDSFG